MFKRCLLTVGLCVAASCSLYDEPGLPTFDVLRTGGGGAGNSSEAITDKPLALRPDAGTSNEPSVDGGAADSGTIEPAPLAGHDGAHSSEQGGAAAAGTGALAADSGVAGQTGSVAGHTAADSGTTSPDGPGDGGSAGASNSADGGSAGAAAAAGSGGSAGTAADPSCPEPGGRTWSANGHCYFPLLSAATWNVSRDTCGHSGAKLATVTSADELSFVSQLIGSTPTWIGLARFGAPQFSWTTGEALSFTNWATGEPDFSGEAAVAMHHDTGAWFDEAVGASHPAICERL